MVVLSQAAALVLLAFALLVSPRSLTSIRLDRALAAARNGVGVDGGKGRPGLPEDRSGKALAGSGGRWSGWFRSRWLSRSLAGAALLALAHVWSWPVAIVVIAAGLTFGRGLLRAQHDRAAARAEQAAVEGLGVLVAELRAGRSGGEALAAAGRHCGHPRVGDVLSRLGRSLRLGDRLAVGVDGVDGDRAIAVAVAPFSFRARAPAVAPFAGRYRGQGRTGPDWQSRLVDGLRLSQASGCALAAVVAAVESDLARSHQQRADLRAAAAGHRATVALLAGLPILGLAMGGGIGADPIHVLTDTPLGAVLLLAGVGLELLGLAWSRRITAAAIGDG